MSDVHYRPLTAGELHLFETYPTPSSGVGVRSRPFAEDVADGQYRPDWIWVALRDDQVIARVAFWAPPDATHPWAIDWFDPGTGPDRVEIGTALLRAACTAVAPSRLPNYRLFLPADWRDRPAASADAADRITVAEGIGLTRFVERLNLRWTLANGLPPRSTRLRFGPATDNDWVADVLARVYTDSLDVGDRRDVELHGPRQAAKQFIDGTAEFGRDWWRLAYDSAGNLVGIVMPTTGPSAATISYLGVVPEHRGQHYCDDLVAEAMHIFTEAGQQVANDATDVDNVPMAASFARVGYQVVARSIVFA